MSDRERRPITEAAFDRWVRRAERQNALTPEAATPREIGPLLLEPCGRAGGDGDWWREQHMYCTGSHHVGPGPDNEILCSCGCHAALSTPPEPKPLVVYVGQGTPALSTPPPSLDRRLRAIEAAARAFFEGAHECPYCVNPDDHAPDCPWDALRAALEGAPDE